jgi:hypothetical protein
VLRVESARLFCYCLPFLFFLRRLIKHFSSHKIIFLSTKLCLFKVIEKTVVTFTHNDRVLRSRISQTDRTLSQSCQSAGQTSASYGIFLYVFFC